MSFFEDPDVTNLISADEIVQRIASLGKEITHDYHSKELIVVGVLNGCFMFFSDLVRQIELPVACDFLGLSSYGSATKSSGVVAFTKDLSMPIENKHVLIVEDIVDTGLTMSYLIENFQSRKPSSIRVCSLLSKPARRVTEVNIDYLGFSIEDKFVVGYGLDFAGKYRNLPYIGVYSGDESQ